jgi:hypothetical protein
MSEAAGLDPGGSQKRLAFTARPRKSRSALAARALAAVVLVATTGWCDAGEFSQLEQKEFSRNKVLL